MTSMPSMSGRPTSSRTRSGRRQLGGRQALAARGALADDVEAVGFQQRAGGATEPGVVVDDENGLGHTHKMPQIGQAQKPR